MSHARQADPPGPAGLCWLNGRLTPLATARIDPADRGLTLGDGLFETMAVRDGRAAHLGRHLDRLAAGCAVLGLQNTWSRADMAAGVAAVAAQAGSVRLTLTRGPGARGVLPAHGRPTLLIMGHASVAMGNAARVMISQTTRRNEWSPLSRIKSIDYLDSILARAEAHAAGLDDAILLNTAGLVAEATSANVMVLRRGQWLTPPVADGALPGIARGLLMERAGVKECGLTVADLLAAEAVLLTNSLGVRAVRQIDATEIPSATEGVAVLWGHISKQGQGALPPLFSSMGPPLG